MPSIPFLYSDFHGGLNTKDAYDLLADNESRAMVNVQGTTTGSITKRLGCQDLAQPTGGPSMFTSLFALESVSPAIFVASGGTFLYSVTTGGTVTQIKTGLTNSTYGGPFWQFVSAPVVSAQGPLFGMNGVDTPQQWSGSGSTASWTNASGGVAVPNGKYCIYHQNQVFVAGVSSTPSRLYWSAIADPTNWDPASLTGAGFMDFDPNDGEAISGIGRVGPYVIVFKPTKTWILVDPATATARRLSDSVGCLTHRSIATGPEGLFFLSPDRGVYLTNGSKLTPISDKVLPTIYARTGNTQFAAGVYFNGHYYLSLATTQATLNDTVLDFDTTLGSWWQHAFGNGASAGVAPFDWAILHSNPSTLYIVTPDATPLGGPAGRAAQAFTPTVYQDFGANFTWSWTGPWQSPTFYRRRRFPTPYFRKRLRQIRYDGLGQVDVSLARDWGLSATSLATDVFANSTIITPGTRKHGQGVANVFSMIFSGTYSTQATVTSYTWMVADRKDQVVA